MFVLNKEHPVHGMMAVESTTLTPEQHQKVVRFISANHYDDPAYRAKEGVNPFLQGSEDVCKPGPKNWVLIEFWSRDEEKIQQWINLLNQTVFR